jgi:hypothetical protein
VTGTLALLLGGILVGVHGHRPLLWLADRRVDPTILLTGWTLLTIGFLGSTVAMIGLLALPTDDHPSEGIFHLAGGCWTAVTAGVMPGWRQAFAAGSIAATIAILARLSWAGVHGARARSGHAPHLEKLRLLASTTPAGEPLWVDDERAMALAIGGRPGLIIATEGLRRRLPPAALAATLEHERAHLRGRHHVLVTVAETLATALPWCPLLRASPSATKDLVELAADASAARRCGPEAVQAALRHLTGQSLPVYGLAMGSHLTEVRLSRLASGHATGGPLRWFGSTIMAMSTLALPAATGWLGVNIVGCVLT